MTHNERIAEQFIAAVKLIAEKPDNLDNFECYLSRHFAEWLKKYANTPEAMVAEFRAFAEMTF